jgi:hypothetical protein
MFPNFCGAMGVAGWLVMLLVWTGLIALVVWAITRLFPGRPSPNPPQLLQPRQPDDAASPIKSGRR